MKRNLLTTAMALALATTLSGCGGSGETADSSSNSTLPAAQAATASVAFSANIPQAEASAAVINGDTSALVIKMYPLFDLLNAIENTYPDAAYWSSDVRDQLAKYTETPADQLTPEMTMQFAEQASYIVNDMYDMGLDLDAVLPGSISKTLTATANTVAITGIATGPYFIQLVQKNAADEKTSTQRMYANLGAGSNAVEANMMSGSWTFVDAQDVAQPLKFPLLESTDAAYAKDWNPQVEGTQTFMETYTNGGSQVSLNKVHYLSGEANPFSDFYDLVDHWVEDDITYENYPVDVDGNRLNIPSNFLFDFTYTDADVAPATKIIAGHYSSASYDSYDSYSMDNFVQSLSGDFEQAYDYRLLDGQKNISAPGFFEMELSTWSETNGELSGGANIITLNNFASDAKYGSDDAWTDSYTDSYTDANGELQTLYMVNAGNWTTALTVADGQTDPTQLDKAKVTGGNVITGILMEYQRQNVSQTVGVITDDSDMKPTAAPDMATTVGMALAMNSIATANGWTAQSSAVHPLGANCSDLTDNSSDKYANYAWINNEWVGGSYNYSYYTLQDGTGATTVYGDDMNGNGIVEYFEAGVVENTYSEQASVTNAIEIAVINYVEVAVEGSSYNYGDYIHISDLMNINLWTQDTMEPNRFIDNAGNIVTLENDGTWDEASQTTISADYDVLYAQDFDGDGQAEHYESGVGYEYTNTNEITVCTQPVRLKGAELDGVTRNDFYETFGQESTSSTSTTTDTTTNIGVN